MPGKPAVTPVTLVSRVFAAGLLATLAFVAGCGTGFTPEQKAAMNKVRFLGGKLTFKDGGYQVDLQQTPVEDKDLEILRQIGNVTSLDLRGTRVTDEGLPFIEQMTTLQNINVLRTGVTREGGMKLRQALPKAEVTF